MNDKNSMDNVHRNTLPISLRRQHGKIICAGDSLIAGVGCTKEDAVFPGRIARTLANQSQMAIHWQSYSDVGGDVQALHRMLIHQVVIPVIDSTTNSCDININYNNKHDEIDAVILMCGLNDWKRVYQGRTPEFFYQDLKHLIKSIHKCFGKDCHVILPALPIHWATVFPEPLYTLVLHLSQQWDGMKEKLEIESRQDETSELYGCKIDYIEVPPGWPSDVLCRDGVHPNEFGYRLWADHIAEKVHDRISYKFNTHNEKEEMQEKIKESHVQKEVGTADAVYIK